MDTILQQYREDFLYPFTEFDVRGGKVILKKSERELRKTIRDEIKAVRSDPVWQMANQMFKDDLDKPFELRPAQLQIFKCIFQRLYPRVHIVSSTQYGKTLNVSRALLSRISAFPEDWLVLVPDTKRGQILLNYMIKDAAENEYFKTKLIGIKDKQRDALNRLLEEKSKTKLTFQIITDDGSKKYGSVEIISCEAKRKKDAINAVMGFGGRNVISDESSLISDEIEAGIFRMFAGKGDDTVYIKIGNPFYRNHFFGSFVSSRYMKIYIDRKIGLADGAYTRSFLEEAMTKPRADVLYDCQFPEADAIDKDGYSPLITDDELEMKRVPDIQLHGRLRLACDVAGGGKNWTVIAVRGDTGAKLLWRSKTKDTMKIAEKLRFYHHYFNIPAEDIYIDIVGIGRGVVDRCKQIIGEVSGVNAGSPPETDGTEGEFRNLRAQMGWRFRNWLLTLGKIKDHSSLSEILVMKYKTDGGGRKIKLISKEELREAGIPSPDCYDVLALLFARFNNDHVSNEEKPIHRLKLSQRRRRRNRDAKTTGNLTGSVRY